MQLLFGAGASDWVMRPFGDSYSFLVIVLPPGAFIVTGFLIAIKNAIDNAAKRRADAQRDAPVKGAKRIRTTGHIT
jgi:electron transport complex protein RnfE